MDPQQIELIPATITEDSLEFTRAFRAPPARVFRAWTDPSEIRRWWGVPLFPCQDCTIDLRVDGAWRVEMQSADGPERVTFFGEYREVIPDQKLVMTWHMDGPDSMRDTLVTLEFRPGAEGGCELFVRHEGFTLAERRDGHHMGWTTSLQALDELLSHE